MELIPQAAHTHHFLFSFAARPACAGVSSSLCHQHPKREASEQFCNTQAAPRSPHFLLLLEGSVFDAAGVVTEEIATDGLFFRFLSEGKAVFNSSSWGRNEEGRDSTSSPGRVWCFEHTFAECPPHSALFWAPGMLGMQQRTRRLRPETREADSGQVVMGGGRAGQQTCTKPLLCAWHRANHSLPPCHPGRWVPFCRWRSSSSDDWTQ